VHTSPLNTKSTISLQEINMNTTATSRILATLMSLTVTFGVLDAVALYSHAAPSKPQAQSLIAGESATLSAFTWQYASLSDSM